jgi:hypothetical protein
MANFKSNLGQDGIYGIRVRDKDGMEVALLSFEGFKDQEYTIETVGDTGYLRPKPTKQRE